MPSLNSLLVVRPWIINIKRTSSSNSNFRTPNRFNPMLALCFLKRFPFIITSHNNNNTILCLCFRTLLMVNTLLLNSRWINCKNKLLVVTKMAIQTSSSHRIRELEIQILVQPEQLSLPGRSPSLGQLPSSILIPITLAIPTMPCKRHIHKKSVRDNLTALKNLMALKISIFLLPKVNKRVGQTMPRLITKSSIDSRSLPWTQSSMTYNHKFKTKSNRKFHKMKVKVLKNKLPWLREWLLSKRWRILESNINLFPRLYSINSLNLRIT